MQSHSPRCRNCTHTTADVGSLRAHVHTHVHTDSERHEAYTRATSACLGVHATQGSRVSTGPHGCASNAHRRAVQQDGPCMLSPPSLASGHHCVLPERLSPPCCCAGRTSTPTESPQNRTRRPGVAQLPEQCCPSVQGDGHAPARQTHSSRAWGLLGQGQEAGLRLLRRLGSVPEKSNPLPSPEC